MNDVEPSAFIKHWSCKNCKMTCSSVSDFARHFVENVACLEKNLTNDEVIQSRKRKGMTPHPSGWEIPPHTVAETGVGPHGGPGNECHGLVGMENSFPNNLAGECPPMETVNKFWPFLRSFCNSLSAEGASLGDLDGAKAELEETIVNIPSVEARVLQSDGHEEIFSLEEIFAREKLKYKSRKEGLDRVVASMDGILEQLSAMEKDLALCKRNFMALLARKQLERRVISELESTYLHRINAIEVDKTFKQHQEEEDSVLCGEVRNNVQMVARESLRQKHRELAHLLEILPPLHEEDSWVVEGDLRPTKRRRSDPRDEMLPPGLAHTTKRDRKKMSDKMLEKVYGFIFKPAPLTPRSTVPITNLSVLHNFEKSLEGMNIFPSTYSIMRGRKAALVNQFEFLTGYDKVNFRFRAFLQSDKKQKVEVLPLLVPNDPCPDATRCPIARELKETLKISDEALIGLVQAWRKAVGNFENVQEAKFSQTSQQLSWVKARSNAIRQHQLQHQHQHQQEQPHPQQHPQHQQPQQHQQQQPQQPQQQPQHPPHQHAPHQHQHQPHQHQQHQHQHQHQHPAPPLMDPPPQLSLEEHPASLT